MLGILWFFSLVFLGTVWCVVPVEEVKYAESGGSIPSFEIIESILRSSFENVSRNHLLGDVRSSRVGGDNMGAQEDMSYLHHGMHAPNADSWRLECVWDAMFSAEHQLRQVLPGARKSDRLGELAEVKRLCTSLAWKTCGADFNEVNCDPNFEYRSVNGTCNNLINTRWGAASEPFERYLQADYGDGVSDFRSSKKGSELPNPRTISRILSNSTQRDPPKITLMLMQWGQFIDHDITLTPERERHVADTEGSKTLMCCDRGQYSNSESLGKDCRPIDVQNDSFYKRDSRQCIRFIRSMPSPKECSFTPMEQINQNTAFIDGSQVYGSTEEVADFVRTKTLGMLNVTSHNNGQPLPPRGGDDFQHRCPSHMQKCFLAGDDRVDEVPGLTAMHTTFIRLHNIIAEGLHGLNNHWDDERLFQETRRIVSALTQQITYRDWLPHVLGPTLMQKFNLNTGTHGYKDTYNPNVNPTIRNVFSAAAFRFGHSLVTDQVKTATTNLPLEGNFFNPSLIERSDTSPSSLLKGLSRCPSSPVDGFIVPTLTNKLLASTRSNGEFFGLDLLSLNIQRGRDHGIPSYNEWRHFCGLERIKDFNELRDVMEEDIANGFAGVYENINGTVDDVDLFPAALSEFPIDDGLLGPTFSCILARQFDQLKHGDRFWYESVDQPKPFTPAQLISIRSQNLTSILCKVSEHTQHQFQPDPFLVDSDYGNGEMDCSNINFINLQPWKERVNLHEVIFPTSGGVAKATDSYDNNYLPTKAFGGSGFWHSGSPYTVPKSLWYEFPEPIRVVKYSFTSRPNTGLTVPDGPSKYIFWASNDDDCSKESQWEILHEDNSGTPFTQSNEPKMEYISNNNYYRCYGFKVTDVPGRGGSKYVSIGNVRYYSLPGGCVSLGGVLVGSQCLSFSTDALSWSAAAAACTTNGGQLATLADPNEVLDYAKRTYGGNTFFWTGGTDTANEGSWVWMTGEPFSGQFPWGLGEPSGSRAENCLELRGSFYNDLPCHSRRRYICELAIHCPEGYFSVGAQCFIIPKNQFGNTTWDEAQAGCKADGYILAEPNSIPDFRKAISEKSIYNGFWLGGSDREQEGVWKWSSDGAKFFNSENWFPGQPNDNGGEDYGGEDCLVLLMELTKDKPLADRHCTKERHDFVCEII